MENYLKEKWRTQKGLRVVVNVESEEGEVATQGIELHEDAWAVDDVSGVKLDPKKVLEARLEEMRWMRKKGVYKKITRQEAKRRGMKRASDATERRLRRSSTPARPTARRWRRRRPQRTRAR